MTVAIVVGRLHTMQGLGRLAAEPVMKRDLHTALLFMLGLLLSLILTPSALATSPQTHTFSGTNSDVVHCGTFDDNFTDVFSGRETTYFDRAGSPIRIVEHAESHSTDTNSATGLSLHEHDQSTTTVDLRTGQVSIVGGPIRMNRKGQGIVIHDTGIVVFDAAGNTIFEGGPHELLNQGDQLFCAALS
jgi:hypothetical protein